MDLVYIHWNTDGQRSFRAASREESYSLFSSRSPSRGGFSAEDLVLGAQRDSRKASLEKTEQLQESRKKEKIVSADHLKAMISQEARS
jgi:hypothetical protein